MVTKIIQEAAKLREERAALIAEKQRHLSDIEALQAEHNARISQMAHRLAEIDAELRASGSRLEELAGQTVNYIKEGAL